MSEPGVDVSDRELLTRAERLLTQLWKELLSVKPWLDKPYPDAPELSPWTRRSEGLARRAHDLSRVLRKRLAADQDSQEPRQPVSP
jgi:hypothetical protein